MKIKVSSTDPATLRIVPKYSTLMSALSPARDILHTIHFDHLYSTPNSSQRSGNVWIPAQTEDTRRSGSRDIKSNSDDYGTPEQETRSYSDNCECDTDIGSLNADSIQQVFQNMINMTALTPIADAANGLSNPGDDLTALTQDSRGSTSNTPVSKSSKIHNIKLVSSLPHTPQVDLLPYTDNFRKCENAEASIDTPDDKKKGHKERNGKTPNATKNQEKKTKTKKFVDDKSSSNTNDKHVDISTAISTPTEVGEDEWKAMAKCLEAERELNILIKHTTELLVLRWSEYLSMTMEEIRGFEVRNAREIGAVEEVVEMLEDKDRYVWELVEQLQFH